VTSLPPLLLIPVDVMEVVITGPVQASCRGTGVALSFLFFFFFFLFRGDGPPIPSCPKVYWGGTISLLFPSPPFFPFPPLFFFFLIGQYLVRQGRHPLPDNPVSPPRHVPAAHVFPFPPFFPPSFFFPSGDVFTAVKGVSGVYRTLRPWSNGHPVHATFPPPLFSFPQCRGTEPRRWTGDDLVAPFFFLLPPPPTANQGSKKVCLSTLSPPPSPPPLSFFPVRGLNGATGRSHSPLPQGAAAGEKLRGFSSPSR